MRVVVTLLGSVILVGWAMIEGLRLYLFLERYAPQLAASALTRNRVVFAGLVIGMAMAARSFELWTW